MVQIRISVAFVALSAFLAVSALPTDVAGSRALQARQVPCASSSSTSEDDTPRLPPQARAWEKRQRNRPGPGQGQNQGQGQQAPAAQTQGQAARPQARPNANANVNANANAQANRRPPQARDLGVIMRSAIAANDELASEDIQLRGLQERQRVQPFPEQQDQNPPPPPQSTQPPPPRTPGRLMRMRERRQAGRQGQNGQPQDQNNQPPPPVPTPSPSPPPAPAPPANNGNARPGDRVPRSASRLFGRQRQGGNQPNAGNGAPQNNVPPPPASTTTTPPAPRPTPGNNNPVPAPNNAADPNGRNGVQNGRQQRSAEVVTEDVDADLEERDSLVEEDEEEL
ncbi:unnamed protein product [Rhizoctonia solani]|uniref:Uncharacterized protein n=1 Tax=Rhizoctonia solani TaxID=456999 RepID=A0A8H3AVM2_9AGAM|nr:unnamed protein product [Rhizoctonia solani]